MNIFILVIAVDQIHFLNLWTDLNYCKKIVKIITIL